MYSLCANNHAFDQQSIGAARTLDYVKNANMIPVGVVRDVDDLWEPQIVERAGLRVAFLAVSDGLNRGAGRRPAAAHIAFMNDARLPAAIANARSLADIVVLAVHWSYDYAPGASRRQRRLAHGWVEAGVDLVPRHGSSCPAFCRADRITTGSCCHRLFARKLDLEPGPALGTRAPRFDARTPRGAIAHHPRRCPTSHNVPRA